MDTSGTPRLVEPLLPPPLPNGIPKSIYLYTSLFTLSRFLKFLQRAVWPRVLTFSAPDNSKEEREDQPALLELVVSEPEIVSETRCCRFVG